MRVSPQIVVEDNLLKVSVWDSSGEWFSFGLSLRRTSKGRLKVDSVYRVPSPWARTDAAALPLLYELLREARRALVEEQQ